MLMTFDTSHLEISTLKDDAPRNIPNVFVTLDTSHCDTSALNDVAPANMRAMLVTRETSQFPIGPFGPLEQSPTADN